MSKPSIIVEKDHDGFILNTYGPFASEESAQANVDALLGKDYNFKTPRSVMVIEPLATPLDLIDRAEQIQQELDELQYV